jgi:hypothetical protein
MVDGGPHPISQRQLAKLGQYAGKYNISLERRPWSIPIINCTKVVFMWNPYLLKCRMSTVMTAQKQESEHSTVDM